MILESFQTVLPRQRFTGVHDTERFKSRLSNFELDIIEQLHNKLKNRN